MGYTTKSVLIRFAAFTALICPLVAISFSQRALAQQSRRVQGWEYCAITDASPSDPAKINLVMDKYTGVATICYFRSSGCRREEVTFDLSYADSLKLRIDADSLRDVNTQYAAAVRANAASMRATESALSKAISKLGDDGWEIVGDNQIKFPSGADNGARAIYFKRRMSR